MVASCPQDGSGKTGFDDRGSWCLGLGKKKKKRRKRKSLFGNSICACLSEEDKGISEADGKGKEH